MLLKSGQTHGHEIFQFNISISTAITRIGRHHPNILFSLRGATLNSDNKIRDLGIVYDSSLNVDNYVHEIVRKASRNSNIILRAFKVRDASLLFKLFNLYVRPIL